MDVCKYHDQYQPGCITGMDMSYHQTYTIDIGNMERYMNPTNIVGKLFLTTKEGMVYDHDGMCEEYRFPNERDLKNMFNLHVAIWTSPVEVNDNMDKDMWKTCRAIKILLNQHPSAVFWHETSSVCEMGMIAGLHAHIIMNPGTDLPSCELFQYARKEIIQHGGIFHVKRVEDMRIAAGEIIKTSSIFAGSNNRHLLKNMRRAKEEVTGIDIEKDYEEAHRYGSVVPKYNNPLVKLMNDRRNRYVVDLVLMNRVTQDTAGDREDKEEVET